MTESSASFHGSPHPDSRREAQYFHDHRVYSLQLEINQACPQGCLYCYASCSDPPEKELDTQVIRRLLKEAVGLGIPAIDWLGGDPLLRNGWEDLLEYAAGLGLVNNIWTSGIPLSDADTARNAVRLTEGGFISVHLDSLDPALYRRLHTGRADAKIEAILTGVENVLESGKNPGQMLNCITSPVLSPEMTWWRLCDTSRSGGSAPASPSSPRPVRRWITPNGSPPLADQ